MAARKLKKVKKKVLAKKKRIKKSTLKLVTSQKSKGLIRVGWKEWVGIPKLGITRMKAKVDSGALTSALHATEIQVVHKAGIKRVRFRTCGGADNKKGYKWVSAPLLGYRNVKSSNGQVSRRPAVELSVKMGKSLYQVKFTLIDRDAMGFNMLLGRNALRDRFLIDVSASFLLLSSKKKDPK